MSIAVCTLGCTRKATELHSWETLFQLEGDYSLYINYEHMHAVDEHAAKVALDSTRSFIAATAAKTSQPYSYDEWSWGNVAGERWRSHPKFDQDQARLASIVCARNMCIEYAMQTNASHLLFVDADIIPPRDIIQRLLAVDHHAVGGYVSGRGAHSGCVYVFGEKRRFKKNGIDVIEAEHGNIGYTMLSRRAFEQVRFRYGVTEYPDGRKHMVSDDPAYHLDCFMKFGEWMLIREDAVGKHVGDLDASQVAQF